MRTARVLLASLAFTALSTVGWATSAQASCTDLGDGCIEQKVCYVLRWVPIVGGEVGNCVY